MNRLVAYASLVLAAAAALVGGVVRSAEFGAFAPIPGVSITLNAALSKSLFVAAVAFAAYGCYVIVAGFVVGSTAKRRAHDARNVLRLLFGTVAVVCALGVITAQWVGVLLSLGVVGFAVTFALQQPLLSLLAWFYIMVKRPYVVGDRVKIDETKGDVITVDFLVTTIWEINGDLVSTNQPSGRVVTVPNSVVLSSHVVNFGGAGIPHVWNELSIQVAYETDLDFARSVMIDEAVDLLGDEMRENIAAYRDRLAETPVELEVADRPTVNVVEGETWIELHLRYLVHPRRGTRVKNELYERILARFNEHPDRVGSPLGRSR